jgi:hypothetical protein
MSTNDIIRETDLIREQIVLGRRVWSRISDI